MANVCCDDVYFYSDTNSSGLQTLWEDLETCIIFCPDPDKAWIGNLYKYKGISTDGISLRGTVGYLEKNDHNILLSTDTAWAPLFEAYQRIADTYGVDFVMRGIEPGEGIYFNTDHSGQYFPERYILSIADEELLTPAGIPIKDRLEYGETFENDTTLFQRFTELGYHADTIDKLNLLLEDVEITIHPFEDPYSSDDSKRRKCA